MKTSILSKSILVLAVMFLCNLAMSAASPREYMYDTKEENGKVISKVIFLNDNGLLNKEVKYEFSYNENGKVSEKKAYRWNKSKDEWVPYYRRLIHTMQKQGKSTPHTECGIKRRKVLA